MIDLNTCTADELIEHVIHHLIRQGMPAINDVSECVYRGDDGTSCAVGCLISDECYSTNMEGLSINNPSVQAAFMKSNGISEERMQQLEYVMEMLQAIHDETTGCENMKDTIADIVKNRFDDITRFSFMASTEKSIFSEDEIRTSVLAAIESYQQEQSVWSE